MSGIPNMSSLLSANIAINQAEVEASFAFASLSLHGMGGIYGMRIIQIIHKKLLKSLASAGVFVLQCLKRSHWEW